LWLFGLLHLHLPYYIMKYLYMILQLHLHKCKWKIYTYIFYIYIFMVNMPSTKYLVTKHLCNVDLSWLMVTHIQSSILNSFYDQLPNFLWKNTVFLQYQNKIWLNHVVNGEEVEWGHMPIFKKLPALMFSYVWKG
jgi:hypothetical protein